MRSVRPSVSSTDMVSSSKRTLVAEMVMSSPGTNETIVVENGGVCKNGAWLTGQRQSSPEDRLSSSRNPLFLESHH